MVSEDGLISERFFDAIFEDISNVFKFVESNYDFLRY